MRIMTLITAFAYLFAVPRGFSPLYESVIESLLFVLTLALAIRFYLNHQGELAIVTFVVAVFYNPLFLISFNIERSPVLDSCVAFAFFILALCWSSVISNSTIHKHAED